MLLARRCIRQPQKSSSCLWATKASRELFAFKMCSQRHIKQRAQPSSAPPTARLSKCTISSVTRACSGMTTLKPQQRSTHVLEHAHRRIMGSFCTQKMLATAPQIARATLGRATPLAQHPNAPSRALYGPGVARQARPQPQHRNAPHACFQHAQRHRGIPSHAKGARNSSTC